MSRRKASKFGSGEGAFDDLGEGVPREQNSRREISIIGERGNWRTFWSCVGSRVQPLRDLGRYSLIHLVFNIVRTLHVRLPFEPRQGCGISGGTT